MARICVVGENLAMSRLLGGLLAGSHFVHYCDAGSRYETCKCANFDLIILDIAWADSESGWNALTYLHQLPALRRIPLVVCSGRSNELSVKQPWLQERGIGILEKPFEMSDLDECVEAALGRVPTHAVNIHPK